MRLPDAEISGWVCIRPIRVGIVFKPTIEAVVAAVQHATGSWGGIYFPFIDPTDQDKALRQATALDVDVFVPIDDNPASIQLSNVDGYRWRGRAEWSPFGHGIGRLTRHVKGTDWIIDEDASQAKLFLPAWEDDALNGLYSVLYGKFGDDDHSRQQAAAFKRRARRIQIQSGDSWPPFWQTNTPISLTAREMTYTGDSGGNGVVVLDPQDPEQLCYFWNLRASGSNVVPWVVGDEARFATMVSAWLEDALELGYLSGWRRGDGRDAGPTAVIFKGDEQEMPVSLIDICDGLGISVIHADMRELSAGGWTGNHPFSTHFANTFNASLSRRGVFEIPLPRLGNARWHRGHQPGRVAADIRISSATNLPPDWVVLLPASRKLGTLLDRITETTEAFARPTVNGRAMDVLADSAMAILSPVRSMSALERLLAEPGWSVRQTDRGRFSMRLIQMLGGSDSYVANQPAIRAVLTTTAAAHDGRPMSALIQAANNYRGKWPGPLTPERAAQEYPLNAVRYLLQKKVLQPALPVRCPDCTAKVAIRAEDLKSEMVCELCGSVFPLGLALGMHTRNDWLYRLPNSIPSDRLSETLPVMSALSVLSDYGWLSALYPYVLGMEISAPGLKCEVDIIATLSQNFPPLIVVGEVKSFRDTVTSQDLQNLRQIQSHLRSKGIECFILAATLRDTLPDDTIAALRAMCEDAQDTLSPLVNPVLPIVLTGNNLSVPPHDDDHPMSWVRPGSGMGIAGIALESCRRNLGLKDIKQERDETGVYRWTVEWVELETN